MDYEQFTNSLGGFNMYKLIHKPIRIKKHFGYIIG